MEKTKQTEKNWKIKIAPSFDLTRTTIIEVKGTEQKLREYLVNAQKNRYEILEIKEIKRREI